MHMQYGAYQQRRGRPNAVRPLMLTELSSPSARGLITTKALGTPTYIRDVRRIYLPSIHRRHSRCRGKETTSAFKTAVHNRKNASSTSRHRDANSFSHPRLDSAEGSASPTAQPPTPAIEEAEAVAARSTASSTPVEEYRGSSSGGSSACSNNNNNNNNNNNSHSKSFPGEDSPHHRYQKRESQESDTTRIINSFMITNNMDAVSREVQVIQTSNSTAADDVVDANHDNDDHAHHRQEDNSSSSEEEEPVEAHSPHPIPAPPILNKHVEHQPGSNMPSPVRRNTVRIVEPEPRPPPAVAGGVMHRKSKKNSSKKKKKDNENLSPDYMQPTVPKLENFLSYRSGAQPQHSAREELSQLVPADHGSTFGHRGPPRRRVINDLYY